MKAEFVHSAVFLQYGMCLTFIAGMLPQGDASLQLRSTGLNHIIFLQTENSYILDLPAPGWLLTQLFGTTGKYSPCAHESYWGLLQLAAMEAHKLLHLSVTHQAQSQDSKPVWGWFANHVLVLCTYKDRTLCWALCCFACRAALLPMLKCKPKRRDREGVEGFVS